MRPFKLRRHPGSIGEGQKFWEPGALQPTVRSAPPPPTCGEEHAGNGGGVYWGGLVVFAPYPTFTPHFAAAIRPCALHMKSSQALAAWCPPMVCFSCGARPMVCFSCGLRHSISNSLLPSLSILG